MGMNCLDDFQLFGWGQFKKTTTYLSLSHTAATPQTTSHLRQQGAFQIIVAPMVPFRCVRAPACSSSQPPLSLIALLPLPHKKCSDQIVAFFKGDEEDGATGPAGEAEKEAELWRRRLSLMGIGMGSGCVRPLGGDGGW